MAPYSHAVESDGWIQLTGQIPNHPEDDSRPLPEGIEAQTERTMENLKIVLGELGLTLADGGAVLVRAAPEPVVDIRCESAAHAAKVAWHIGNRHAPLQVLADGGLRIQDDHVLAGMAEGLGAATRRRQAPFSPEPGAYAHAASNPGEDRG